MPLSLRQPENRQSVDSFEVLNPLDWYAFVVDHMSTLRLVLLLLVWLPIWLFAIQVRKIARQKQAFERRRSRYETYVCIEEAIREIRNDLPISQQLAMSGEVIPRPAAKRIYQAQPKGGPIWDEKVAITELLERIDRLAIGVQVGILDVDVWYKLSGHRIVALCRILRNFISISQDARGDRYYAIDVVNRTFRAMDGAQEAAQAGIGVPQSIQRRAA